MSYITNVAILGIRKVMFGIGLYLAVGVEYQFVFQRQRYQLIWPHHPL